MRESPGFLRLTLHIYALKTQKSARFAGAVTIYAHLSLPSVTRLKIVTDLKGWFPALLGEPNSLGARNYSKFVNYKATSTPAYDVSAESVSPRSKSSHFLVQVEDLPFTTPSSKSLTFPSMRHISPQSI